MDSSPGPIVLYRIGGPDDAPELRPALVVRCWSPTCLNLQVLFDGLNDRYHADRPPGFLCASDEEAARGIGWRTSVLEGDGVGCWRRAVLG